MIFEPFIFGTAILIIALTGDLFGIEVILISLAALLCFRTRAFAGTWFETAERLGCRIAERKWTASLVAGAAAIVLRLALLPWVPVPHAVISDEFSHLLIADTFAHGRLANPAHPLWRSFETLQVNQQPTYSSMYFPGPGLLLFLGQIVTGVPWAGLLLTMGLLCGAICWALQGWMPARWAFLGGLLAALKFGLESYWINSYWGGASGALGGALVLGALPRIRKNPSVGVSITMATGIVLLATSRPWEGLALCLPVCVSLAAWLLASNRIRFSAKLTRFVIPALACLLVAGAGLCVYFNAVTGSPTVLPYVVHQQAYGWPLTLPWTSIDYVQHSRREFAEYLAYEMNERMNFTSWIRYAKSLSTKIEVDWRFFFGPALTIPLLFVPQFWRNRRLRFLFFTGAVSLVVVLTEPHFPHYLSPVTLAAAALWVQGMRHLRLWRRTRDQAGLRLSRAIPVVLALVVVAQVVASSSGVKTSKLAGYTSWCCSNPGIVDQPSIVERLPRFGKHLILVRYHGSHFFGDEWVFNAADIDSARVVWAKELGGDQDRRLINYFNDRQVWLFEPDLQPPKLAPLAPAVTLQVPGSRNGTDRAITVKN